MLHKKRVTYKSVLLVIYIMLYFKHSELVDNYHVSLKTVHNWIDAAKQGKVDLRLHQDSGKTYIANVPENVAILKQLANKGKKYRNTLHQKVIAPKPEFYDLFSRRQILDIIHNINIHREIPRQYNYFNGGAISWDKWIDRLETEQTPSTFTSTVELLQQNLGSIDHLTQRYKQINVIDIGVGNARPAMGLLAHLLERGVLGRYIAIDISDEMLNIAERNIKEEFGDKIRFERHVRDISYERFDDLLVDDMLSDDSDQIVNIMLLFGATPVNFRSPYDVLKTIYSSMDYDDLLIYTLKPDSEMARGYFDFNVSPGSQGLSPKHSTVLDALNIDESLYDVEMGFNEQKRMRYIRIRLKVALSIEFTFEGVRRSLKLEKGEAILLLRAWHQTPLEIISDFEKTGFKLLQSSLTKDRQYLMTISGVDAEAEG